MFTICVKETFKDSGGFCAYYQSNGLPKYWYAYPFRILSLELCHLLPGTLNYWTQLWNCLHSSSGAFTAPHITVFLEIDWVSGVSHDVALRVHFMQRQLVGGGSVHHLQAVVDCCILLYFSFSLPFEGIPVHVDFLPLLKVLVHAVLFPLILVIAHHSWHV